MIIARSTVGDEGLEAKLEVGGGVHKVQYHDTSRNEWAGLNNGCTVTVS